MADNTTKVEGAPESQHSNNAVLSTVPKITGDIHVSYGVHCPQCGKHYDDFYDKDWWEETFGLDFPIDNALKREHEAKCDGCGQLFIVDGFVY